MSTLRSKSSVALLIGIIGLLLLTTMWRTTLAPYVLRYFASSQLEKIDSSTAMEGRGVGWAFGAFEVPILIEAYAYTEEVKGDNVIMKVENKMMNTTDPDKPRIFEEFSGNSTYVFNKFTGKNVWGAPEADKNRTGHFALYPKHLKVGQDIPDVWSENLEMTVTLHFIESTKEEGVTLYRYYNKTVASKEMDLPIGRRNATLTYTTTVLIEPLFGAPAYIANETFSLIAYYNDPKYGIVEQPFVRLLTYKDTNATKAQGLANARRSSEGIQLLESYIPIILGAIAITLIVGLAFNVRRLNRKMRTKKTNL